MKSHTCKSYDEFRRRYYPRTCEEMLAERYDPYIIGKALAEESLRSALAEASKRSGSRESQPAE